MDKYTITNIDIQLTNTKIKEKIERPLLWYDTETKTMKEMKGGELKFNYDFNHIKMLINTGKDDEELVKWIEDNKSFGVEITDNEKTIVRFPKTFDIDKSLNDVKFLYKILKSNLNVEAKPIDYIYNRITDNSAIINNWIEENTEEFKLEVVFADSRNISIKYPMNFMDEVEDSLYEKRLRFESYNEE